MDVYEDDVWIVFYVGVAGIVFFVVPSVCMYVGEACHLFLCFVFYEVYVGYFAYVLVVLVLMFILPSVRWRF